MLEVGPIERGRRRRRTWDADLPKGELTLRDASTADDVANVDELRAALRSAVSRAAAAERRAAVLEDRLRGAWRAAVSRWP